MVTVRLTGVVGEDGQLTAKVPENIPPGPIQLVIELPETGSPVLVNPAREVARAKLAAAGLLSSAYRLPPETHIPTDAEVRAAGILPPGARPSEDLISEDRDERE